MVADRGSPSTVVAVDTETLVMARNLSGLVLLYRSTEHPRTWVRTQAGGRTTHHLYSEGLYDARAIRDRTGSWRIILDVLAFPDGQLGRHGTMADLPGGQHRAHGQDHAPPAAGRSPARPGPGPARRDPDDPGGRHPAGRHGAPGLAPGR